ncbi:unnamed protein product [Euphydryas editha]|uniref:Uncharacterized protein n=1 Tax=Euphydryas editha TaxID=104508 RepID=A0AAU9UXM2_EUPED|nr:unnamed protein product [Euphydryas editha]
MSHGGMKSAKNGNSTHAVETSREGSESLPPPPDGGWGWMIVFASFMIHIVKIPKQPYPEHTWTIRKITGDLRLLSHFRNTDRMTSSVKIPAVGALSRSSHCRLLV